MNWQKKWYDKIKVGDIVECIKWNGGDGSAGAGWKLGFKFTVNKINTATYSGRILYWPKNGSGVYEEYVKKVISK